MARDEDDDDSLPPLGENTDKFLDQAKKGQARNFLLVCKGNKVKYLAVRKKPIKKNELNEAKKAGYKGDGYFGVITGKGMELVFNLSTADGYTSEPVKDKVLKDFLEEKADFKCKPTIAIVASLPAVPFDDEDLNNPLIARFLALDVPITEVLDKNPDAEGELSTTTSEIRALLQDGDFNTAEPRIVAFEARLQALLQGAPADVPPPPPPPPPPQSVPQTPPTSTSTGTPPTSYEPVANNDPLKQKLQEALNKLVPQLKQAVQTYPDKKVELLTPVAQIKNQLDSGELQEAKAGILAVGQLLKSVLAKTATQSPSESQTQTEDPLKAEYERKLAAVQPDYDRVLKEMLGDTSKFKTVMAYVTEQADAGVYANAIKALDRLTQAIATAIAAGKKETDVIPENVVRDRQKFLTSRWQEIIRESHLEIDKLVVPLSQVQGENPQELVAAIRQNLDDFLDDLNDAILGTGTASSGNLTPIEDALKAIQSYRTKIQSDPVLAKLAQAKSSLNVDLKLSEKLLSGLSELESKLAQ